MKCDLILGEHNVSNQNGPRVFLVTLNSKGEAVVTLSLLWAETLKDKLRSYGHGCELSVSTSTPGGEANATLNFGLGADVSEIQRIIDSFTIPPLPVVMG